MTSAQQARVVMALAMSTASVASVASGALTLSLGSADVATAKVDGKLVLLRLEPCAAKNLHELTTKNIGKPLIILFDGLPVLRAHIHASIAGGQIQFKLVDPRLSSKFVQLAAVATVPTVDQECASQSGIK